MMMHAGLGFLDRRGIHHAHNFVQRKRVGLNGPRRRQSFLFGEFYLSTASLMDGRIAVSVREFGF